MEQKREYRTHKAGTATVMAISKMSGGMGKKEDSTKDIANRAGSAYGVAAQCKTQS
tara:strand:- start:78 stop:245 length:168 start_codon:yes stop_codon:yes gene_type:complete